MKSEFKPGDMVRMNKTWAARVEEILGEPPSEKEMKRVGMVYKIGDKYDICFGVGVKWNDDGSFTNVNPDALEIV
jgi:hypothetical protein